MATWTLAGALLLLPGEAFAQGIALDAERSQVLILGSAAADVAEIAIANDGRIRVSLASGGAIQTKLFDPNQVEMIVFRGEAGDDVLKNLTALPMEANGGEGNDRMIGGSGDNSIFGGPGNDELFGGPGSDTLLGESGQDLLFGDAGDDKLQGGDDADILNGAAGNDWLIGGEGNDVLGGEDGDDVLTGEGGDDSLEGGPGTDWLKGGAGDDALLGGADNDLLQGDEGNDFLRGDGGDDTIAGGEGDDVLDGGVDHDILAGGDGNDQMRGGDGNDGLDGGFDHDVLLGGAGNDALVGDAGSDYLAGGEGDDFLLGGPGVDALYGEGGDDLLRGDLADDAIEGGTGNDNVRDPAMLFETPFGIVVNPANMPDSSDADVAQAFSKASAVASKISLFWGFAGQNSLQSRLDMIPAIHNHGKKSFVQIQVQFVGDPTPPEELPQTFGDPNVRALFLENVTRFAELEPSYMNLAPEVNLLYYFNRPEFDNYTTLYQQAYDLIKQISPETQVGVSQHYLMFYAFEQQEVLELLGPRDYVAITSYPIWMLDRGLINSISEISPDYYTWIRDQYPNDAILFSEMGWPTSGQSNSELQADFVRALPYLMAGARPQWVDWTMLNGVNFFHVGLLTDRVLDFLLDNGADPDLIFERLNDIGLHARDGTPRPAWFEALRLDFNR